MVANVSGAGVKWAILALAGCLAGSGAAVADTPQVAAPAARPAPLVPADFPVPTQVETAGFKLVPLAPDLAKRDFAAYMSSIEHLQTTFSRSTSWPHAGITDAEAIADMEGEQARFKARKSFAYSVLTPDGLRERGCVYVSPSPVAGYDAVVRMWVTKADYDAGFDAQLYQWVVQWMHKDWPFAKIAYPGRAIAWGTWDAAVAVAAAKPAKP